MSDNSDLFLCPFCIEEFFSQNAFEEHKRSDEHRITWLNRSYHGGRKNFVQDKHGLSIDIRNDQGPIEYKRNTDTIVIRCDEEITFDIILKWRDVSVSLLLLGADILNEPQLASFQTDILLNDKHDVYGRQKLLRLSNEGSYKITCTIIPGNLCRSLHIPIIFEFMIEDKQELFYYGITLEIVGNYFNLLDFGNYIKGIKLDQNKRDNLEKLRGLAPYDVPMQFTTLAHNNDVTGIKSLMNLDSKISTKTYANQFRTLLWLEELQLHLDIQYYGKKEELLSLAPVGSTNIQFAELMVEGLSENRPSILLNDRIMAYPCVGSKPLKIEKKWYEGYVHSLRSNSVYIAFDQDTFMKNMPERCDIEYIINRSTLKNCHRAVSLCHQELSHLLFPVPPKRCALIVQDNISPYNSKISTNPEQLQAVKYILAGTSYPAPYLIFGPPGTGKTVTLVEAIKQVLYKNNFSRVLACAPSNSAADIITWYLLDHLNEQHLIRLYSSSREKHVDHLNERIKAVSNFDKSNKVFFPSKNELMKKRVIVCTFLNAGRISAAKFPPNFFTHVFLDEVGQAMEPEALVPLGGILGGQGHLILAGDHKQLGPVVRSNPAKGGERNTLFTEGGLEMSYLERLMRREMYSQVDGKFDPRFVTNLLYNYRSHEQILKIPNELFYNSQLKNMADKLEANFFINWPHLPRKQFPLIFHAIAGQDKMIKRSPSYFNPQEIKVVLKYVKLLLGSSKKYSVSEDEIGIISPYRLQVQKIREELRRNQYHNIKIGSVEDFQGEERKVIILSTVRATKANLAKDEIFSLGFLRNPKRFNVAVTRAKSLLIICGCAHVLQLDRCWRKLMDHIKRNGGFIGNEPSPTEEDIESFLSKMSEIDSRPMLGKMSQAQIIDAPKFTEE